MEMLRQNLGLSKEELERLVLDSEKGRANQINCKGDQEGNRHQRRLAAKLERKLAKLEKSL